MGIPKFFRMLSERYPCISQLANETEIRNFDHLYLDMNGIIHNCSHGDQPGELGLNETEFLEAVFAYIETLFRVVKPKKLLYMAIDGVAPRAKMNQQRSRRFRTAKEAEVQAAKAKKSGKPDVDMFDSNCITPGTVFMDKLHQQLQYFVKMKLTNDALWRNVQVVYSGHDCPGEGEHKIMSYIRYIRAQPGYDPNTRHCLYGLDADLIMLGLSSHEPHFALLREEVLFSTKRKAMAKRFYLLHLALVREYLEMEFSELKINYPDIFDLECIVDDWIFMAFLVGNDFLPHLPQFHIHENVLPKLWKVYIDCFGEMGGYLNCAGQLNLARLELYFERLSRLDRDFYLEKSADLCWLKSKSNRHTGLNEQSSSERLMEFEFWSGVCDTEQEPKDDLEDWAWDASMDKEFLEYRLEYYEKFDVACVDPAFVNQVKQTYIEALQWNLSYYYQGVVSWGWFYPYHYSPFVTDLKGFQNMTFTFTQGSPFLPFQQLLAVLPAASRNLVPMAYRDLMVNPDSPLIRFYPEEVEIDLNGKRNDWEAVVKMPFINEELLLAAMAARDHRLTDEERLVNQFGCYNVFSYSVEEQRQQIGFTFSTTLPSMEKCNAKCERLPIDAFDLPPSRIVRGVLPGAKQFLHGFPTFSILPYKHCIMPIGVMLFNYPSESDSVLLSVECQRKELRTRAFELLGRWLLVKYPYCVLGLCIEVSSENERYLCQVDSGERKVKHQQQDGPAQVRWKRTADKIMDELYSQQGIELNELNMLVTCYLPSGMRHMVDSEGNVKVAFSWKSKEDIFAEPSVAIAKNVRDFFLPDQQKTGNFYPAGSVVFSLSPSSYGSEGVVMEHMTDGVLRVSLKRQITVNLLPLVHNELAKAERSWMNLYQLSQRLDLPKIIVNRILGGLRLYTDSRDSRSARCVGFNLKFSKVQMEKTGYSRQENCGNWLYSVRVMEMLSEYLEKFPEVFDCLRKTPHMECLLASEVWSEAECADRMAALMGWLEKLPFQGIKMQPCGSSTIGNEIISRLEMAVNDLQQRVSVRYGLEPQVVDLKYDDVYCPTSVLGKWALKEHTDHRLLDRVVNIRSGYAVPVGLTGTIVSLPPEKEMNNADMLVMFDEEFFGAFSAENCRKRSLFYVPFNAVLNMSHGDRSCSTQWSKEQQALIKSVSVRKGTFKDAYTPTSVLKRNGRTVGRLKASAAAQMQAETDNQEVAQHMAVGGLCRTVAGMQLDSSESSLGGFCNIGTVACFAQPGQSHMLQPSAYHPFVPVQYQTTGASNFVPIVSAVGHGVTALNSTVPDQLFGRVEVGNAHPTTPVYHHQQGGVQLLFNNFQTTMNTVSGGLQTYETSRRRSLTETSQQGANINPTVAVLLNSARKSPGR